MIRGETGQHGVGGDNARETLRLCRSQAQAQQTAPVLAHQMAGTELQVVQETFQLLEMEVITVVPLIAQLVRAAEANQIRTDHPIARLGENRDHLAVEIAPGGFAMEHEHYGRVRRPRVHIMHAELIDLRVVGRKGIAGQIPEAVIRRAEYVVMHDPGSPQGKRDSRPS